MGLAPNVGDPDAPNRALRHTGLDTYALLSPPPVPVPSPAPTLSTVLALDTVLGGVDTDAPPTPTSPLAATAAVVVLEEEEVRMGCSSSPKRSAVRAMKSVGESSSGLLVAHFSPRTSFS